MSSGGRPLILAFGDESFKESDVDGFYVLAAAVFDPAVHDEARIVMSELRGRRRIPKLHWNEMDPAEQAAAVKTLADLDGFHLVAIGSPVPRRRQERARAGCLRRLTLELSAFDVEMLVLESRTATLNARDVETVRGARFDLPKGTQFRVVHEKGKDEPLLWAADIVAGAIRATKDGQPGYRRLIEDLVYEIDVETRC
ncbi:hypothetical protein [Amycolatopsis keratiniphila]|uniref:hypothetical protein n=1 Tax=Amycolatopsis keratiniphila TaxID=129921 RepID=UPI00087BDA38|nr:hypothetical protein [Amycolatopsis keratiniphila]OLZ52072.1 hypothetical protein BS330_25975 [Amycolatopsis keratiniphila subsp. nogabecina]SDU61039.1 hypothetical protein SAMN04489733_6970 [Amycolatopsis keratiniphila]